jgi:hypothetical protein
VVTGTPVITIIRQAGTAGRDIYNLSDASSLYLTLSGTQKHEFTFVAGVGANIWLVDIFFKNNANMSVMIDDVSVREVQTPDVTPNANHGVVYGTVQNASSMEFDGTDDYVNAGSNFNLREEFTISQWLKRDSISTAQVFNSKWNASSPRPYTFLFLVNNSIRLALNSNDSYVDTPSNYVSLTDWIHVVGVYSMSGGFIKLYVDGEEKNSESYSTILVDAPSEDLMIGAERASSPSSYFDGSMKDVRIYNRALTAEEVELLYKLNGEDVGLRI